MTVVLRNMAVPSDHAIQQAQMGGGGDGRALLVPPAVQPKKIRWRMSKDPAAELMPAAEFLGQEPDFAAILEDFRDSPFDPRRRKVLGKLMGVFAMDYQGARSEERSFLKRLLASGNAKEAYAANRALHLAGATPILRRTLALAVGELRFAAIAGYGFLGAVQARMALTTFRLLGPRTRLAVWDLLRLAGTTADGSPLAGAERLLERALILKALAARRHRLGPWSADGPAAVAEIEAFAKVLRGLPRQSLAARTCLVAGDPLRRAPGLDARRGATLAAYQARGDLDPVFAWQEHAAAEGREETAVELGPLDAPAVAVAATPSADALEALGELQESPLLERPRLHQALAESRLRPATRLLPAERQVATDHLAGKDILSEQKPRLGAALDKLRQAFDLGLVALDGIREDARGIYKFDAARALSDLVSRYSGAAYLRRVFSDQVTAAAQPLEQIRDALRTGLVVPVIVRELRLPIVTGLCALRLLPEETGALILREPLQDLDLSVAAAVLTQAQLPPELGRNARADTYLAPAALDLLAPPFGLVFAELGLEDRL